MPLIRSRAISLYGHASQMQVLRWGFPLFIQLFRPIFPRLVWLTSFIKLAPSRISKINGIRVMSDQ